MDQQLLDSFNNLSVALQNLAEALQKNEQSKGSSESMIADALSKMDISEQVKSIDEGVKQLIRNNAEIIATQKSMMESMQKGKPSETEAEGLSLQKQILTMVDNIFKKQQEDSEKIESATKALKKKETEPELITDKKKQTDIKDGVKLVLLIAAGIVAIGLALKIVGTVDFVSVIALSLALPLIAIAFERIARIEVDLDALETALFGLTLLSLTMIPVSFFLSLVSAVNEKQALTVLLIGATFAILGMSIGKISKSVENLSPKGLFIMPFVLIAASVAITASSLILQFVSPISSEQAYTVIMIGAAFAILSLSIAKLTSNIAGVTSKSLLALPLVLISASLSIMASSYLLANVQVVGPFELLTAIGIAAVFAVLSFGLAKIANAVSNVNPIVALMLPLVLIAASFSIMQSSMYLSQVQPITFSQFLTSVGIAIAFIPLAFSLVIISKAFEKLSMAKIIAATVALPILFVAMSYAIVYSSEILKETAEVEPGKLFNIILQSLALSAVAIIMGVAIFALDKLGIASPAGIIKAVSGGIAIVIIAGTIALASQALALGNYTKTPDIDWALGAGASILAFGLLIAVTGSILFATGGTGLAALALGAIAILGIAASILAVDFLFGLGEFRKYPSMEWIEGTAKGIALFGAAYLAIGAAVLATFGVAALAGAIGAVAVVGIAGTMLAIDAIFNLGSFTKFPSMSWIKGVSSSITGFKDLLVTMGGSLGESKGILDFGKRVFSSIGNFVSGVAGATAILGVAGTIVTVDKILSSGNFNKFPSSEWTKSTIDSMKKFSGAIENLEETNPMIAVRAALGIFTVDNVISKGNYTKIISEEYNESLKRAFAALNPMLEAVEDFDYPLIVFAERSAAGIANISNEISKGNYNTNIPGSWASNVVSLFTGYNSILEVVSDMNPGLLSRVASKVGSAIGSFLGVEEGEKMTPVSVAQNIVALSKIISMGNYKAIAANWMDSVYQNMKSYLKIMDLMSGETMSNEILGFSVSMGRGISKIASDYDKLAQGIQKVSAAITNIDLEKVTALRALTGSVVLLSLMDADQFEDVMDALEEKSEILGDLLNKAGGINPELPSVKTASAATPEGPGIREVLGMMAQIDKKLSAIASSSNNISTYVNEIRSSPSKVGLRK